MKLGTTILSVSMLAAALTLAATQVRADEAPASDTMDAPALWKKNCASCHGEDGKGETKAGRTKKVKNLTDPEVRAKFDREKMIKSTKEGIKGDDGKERMKAYAEKLSEAEIATLIDYILNTLK